MVMAKLAVMVIFFVNIQTSVASPLSAYVYTEYRVKSKDLTVLLSSS